MVLARSAALYLSAAMLAVTLSACATGQSGGSTAASTRPPNSAEPASPGASDTVVSPEPNSSPSIADAHGLVVLSDFGKLSDAATLSVLDVPNGSSNYSATFPLSSSLTVSGPSFGTASRDLQYLAARQLQDDGTQHGGYIDTSGTFTDATAPLAQAGSFAGGLNTDRVAFIGDRFYFNLRSTGDSSTDTIYSVALSAVSAGTASTSDYRKEPVAAPSYPSAIPKFAPDGSATKQTNGCVRAYGKWAFNPDGFIGKASFVAVHDGTILEYPLRATCYKSFINGKALLPSSDQTVTELTTSPDTSQIALKTERNQQATWYTVPADGGNPTQVGEVGGASGSLIGWR